MKFTYFWVSAVAVILMVGFLSAQGVEVSSVLFDPLQEIQKNFPDSIRLGVDGERSIEFCPDNTCDSFVANKDVPLETLRDFAYLYIYFFSDYYVLDEWRARARPKIFTTQILSKTAYKVCKSSNEEDAARCLLRHLSRNNQVKLFAVRYDENVRTLVHKDVWEATAITRPKKQ